MITSVYKDESMGYRDTSTNIVNSFVKEWVRQGHEVLVIHNAHCYPKIVHKIPGGLKRKWQEKWDLQFLIMMRLKRKNI